MNKLIKFILAGMLLLSAGVFAADTSQLAQLQRGWAEANYTLQGKAQTTAFETLLAQADRAIAAEPDSAELYIWRGIIRSSYAGAKGGLGALSLAKAAKVDLEKALKIDDKALAGSAYTSLGTLYYKVPGWPIGFGDNGKAETLLKKALSLNPEGIDPNYFYGDFLAQQRKYAQAERYLLKAQQAPARPDRPLADKGRQQDIETVLQQVRYQLQSQSHASITDRR